MLDSFFLQNIITLSSFFEMKGNKPNAIWIYKGATCLLANCCSGIVFPLNKTLVILIHINLLKWIYAYLCEGLYVYFEILFTGQKVGLDFPLFILKVYISCNVKYQLLRPFNNLKLRKIVKCCTLREVFSAINESV